MKVVKKHYLLLFILIFATILLSTNLNKPFIGHHDWNGAWYSGFARNLIRYGLWQTKFGSVLNYDFTTPHKFQYFTHYPPLLPIFIFLSFKVFGVHAWSARLVPLIFTLLTILAIYTLGLKFFDKKIAVMASLIAVLMPIIVYFGKMPVQEVLIIAPVLFSILAYFNFFARSSRRNFIILIVLLVISHLTNWSGYYVTPLFSIHYLIFAKSKNKSKIALVFPLFSLLMFGIHMLYTAWQTANPLGGGIGQAFLFRLNLIQKPQGYTDLNFLKLQARFMIIYFTKTVLLLSIITSFWIVQRIKAGRVDKKVQLFLILGIFGVTHNLVFRNMAFIHDYMIIYLVPFIAFSSSFGFFLLFKNIKNNFYKIVLASIVIFAIISEQLDFTRALQKSSGFKSGFVLGQTINRKSSSGEKTLILSRDFKQHFEVHTGYYADRNIDYQILLPHQSNNYRLIVAIPNKDTPINLINTLQNRYKVTQVENFLIFDTHETAI